MNIQHSSRTDRWYTPFAILAKVRTVLGRIDLDPASDGRANLEVRAERFIGQEEDGLKADWGHPRTIFLNPPGGKLRNRSLAALFWDRLMVQRTDAGFAHAIFLAFSLEQLQTTQDSVMSVGDFPLVVPRRRMRFVRPSGEFGPSPSHSNMLVYVPGRIDQRREFFAEFSVLGSCINRGAL